MHSCELQLKIILVLVCLYINWVSVYQILFVVMMVMVVIVVSCHLLINYNVVVNVLAYEDDVVAYQITSYTMERISCYYRHHS